MIKAETKNRKYSRSSWIFYGSSNEEVIKIQREVDNVFSNYSFYPENEWGLYGYRAPEGHQVLGAWRHPETRTFAFLLDNPHMHTVKPNIQLLLYIIGDKAEIETLEPKCENVKSKFAAIDEKDKTTYKLETRLVRIKKSKPLGIISTMLVLFTAIINAFSLYLRKLPPPEFGSKVLIALFGILVAAVHFASVLLLLIFIVILGIFLIKYGYLLIKQL
jgi:hypothetical protein